MVEAIQNKSDGGILDTAGEVLKVIAGGILGVSGCAHPDDDGATPAPSGTPSPSPEAQTPSPAVERYGYTAFVNQQINGNPFVAYACGDQYTNGSGQSYFDSLCTVTLRGMSGNLRWELNRTQVLGGAPQTEVVANLEDDLIPANMTPLAAAAVEIDGQQYHIASYTGSAHQGDPSYQGVLIWDADGNIVREYDLSVLEVEGRPITGASAFAYDASKDELLVLANNYDVGSDGSVSYRPSALVRIPNPLSDTSEPTVLLLSDQDGKTYKNASAMGRDQTGALVVAAAYGTSDGTATDAILLKVERLDGDKAVVSTLGSASRGIGINGMVQSGGDLAFTGYNTQLAVRYADGTIARIPTGSRQAVFTGNAGVDGLNIGEDGRPAVLYAFKPDDQVSLQLYRDGESQPLGSFSANASFGPVMLGAGVLCWGGSQTAKASNGEDLSQLQCFEPALQ